VRRLACAATLAAAALTVAWGDARAGGDSPPRGTHAASPAPRLTDVSALMLATRAGDVLVGVEATGKRLRVAVIPPDVRRLPARSVHAFLRSGRRLRRIERSCGWNCLELDRAGVLAGRPARVSVTVRLPSRTVRGAVALPARMPRGGGALHARTRRFMNALRAVRVREVLSTGASTVRSTWLYQAPDRASYVASNGSRGVIIGDRRWDYFAGRWTAQATTRLRSPRYMWAEAARGRVLGKAMRRGRRVQVVSLFRPNGSYPAFFRLYVDARGRVLEAEMLAPAHFMVDRLDRFNASIRIRPPA
jgi:hypothetical protein